MKNVKYIVVAFLLFCIPFSAKAVTFDLDSSHAILYNRKENMVLYDKDPDEEVAIASLTKIMTTLVAIEHIPNLDATVIITEEMLAGLLEADASVAGFLAGEEVTYRDLLYGVMLPSGADATRALAFSLMGSEEAFVGLMNEKAKELHLEHTHFINTSGLDAKGHYSSVRDVAKMLEAALANPTFYEIFTASSYETSNQRLYLQSTLRKTANRYNISVPYILGAKTGTTDDAGYCLASIAEYEGAEYLLVTVGAPDTSRIPYHILDAKMIYDYYIENYGYYPIMEEGQALKELSVKYSTNDTLMITAPETILRYLPKDTSDDQLEVVYHGDSIVTPFTKVGKKLGVMQVLYKGEPLKTWDVVMPVTVPFSVISFLQDTYYLPILFIILIVIMVIIKMKRRNVYEN